MVTGVEFLRKCTVSTRAGAALEGRDQVAAHTAQAPGPPSLLFELMPEFWLVCYFSR